MVGATIERIEHDPNIFLMVQKLILISENDGKFNRYDNSYAFKEKHTPNRAPHEKKGTNELHTNPICELTKPKNT